MAAIERSTDDRYNLYMGLGSKKYLHWEHWSCPDAESYLSGYDYYDHPKLCREKLIERYPQIWSGGIPETDEPRPRPKLGLDNDNSSNPDKHTVRWGDGETDTFVHGGQFFHSAEDVFKFSPLEHAAEFANWPVVERRDYSDEQKLYERYRSGFPAEWGDKAPKGSSVSLGFYNTMFMWPLLTFGWDLFLECCLDDEFERIMDEFAEINRRVFRSFAKLPANFAICHDDIVTTRGPVCSPKWMHKYIFPRYEEFWGMLKASGKEVIHMVDGNVDQYADDVIACGARGFVTEPYTDFKAIARKHKDVFLTGEGDNRVLTRNDPDEIKAMVDSMVATSRMTGGYMMSIGNHIPWNVTPEGIKRYLDLVADLTYCD